MEVTTLESHSSFAHLCLGAKPKGKEIRDYVTQRFSSNMVFLSLLLGTDMNVVSNLVLDDSMLSKDSETNAKLT